MKITLALILVSLAMLAIPANAQVCPAVGNDTTCGIIITITNGSASVTTTGQGPYDGADDTLIGVVNNGNVPISTLRLTSALPIFGFDGDGIVSFGISGNAQDTTGYGGPNAFFTNINSAETQGDVNFIVPIAAHGGTGYFSLENALTSASTPCSSLLNNGLSGPVLSGSGLLNGPTTITASFTPNQSTLSQAAATCGFINFDWQQMITSWPSPSSLVQVGNPTPLTAPPSFFDPPPGGYVYELTNGFPNGDHAFPFYYDPTSGELQSQEANDTTLNFADIPKDPCLVGPLGIPSFAWLFNSAVRKSCGNSTALRGSFLAFTTHLVGVNSDRTATDLGIGFSWTDTFNGTFGGITTSKSNIPPDPGSGTGGITIISVNQITNFQAVSVTNVNGNPLGATQPLTSGNACNGTFGGTFNGDITVSAGQNCIFINGTVTGHVRQHGGNLVLSGTLVEKDVRIDDDSTFSIGPFAVIRGDLEVGADDDRDQDRDHDHDRDTRPITDSTVQNQICGTTVNRDLRVRNTGIATQIGSATASSCMGNVVGGDLDVDKNIASIGIFDNTITGDLIAHDNTAAIAIFGNTVSKTLRCENNASITGGGNDAKHKDDQCSRF